MIPIEAIELKNRLNFALYSPPKPLPISPLITPDRIACRAVHRASSGLVHVGWLVGTRHLSHDHAREGIQHLSHESVRYLSHDHASINNHLSHDLYGI